MHEIGKSARFGPFVRWTLRQSLACPQGGQRKGEAFVSHADDSAGSRRDFLYYATAGAGVVATSAAVWPLVNQMNPSADVRALASIDVDICGIAEGSQLTVLWRGKPVFIRYRTADEIKAAQDVALGDLVDTTSNNNNQPETDASDANR
eukprot:gene18056-24575_t